MMQEGDSMQVIDAEVQVMCVVWARPGLSDAEIHQALEVTQDWSRETVKTLLARLAGKGAPRPFRKRSRNGPQTLRTVSR
jgi:predicted transcriptional regulator